MELEVVNALATYGSPIRPMVPVKLVQIPLDKLKVARKGSIYLVKLDVSEMTAEKAAQALEALAKGLREEFGATLLYGKATKNEIYLQVAGSPFSWLALLAWLPTILGLLGIALFMVSVWQVIASVPSWIWATLVISAALILFGPAIGELVLRAVEGERR